MHRYRDIGWHSLFMEHLDNRTDISVPAPDHVIAFLNDRDGRLKKNLIASFPESKVSTFPVFPAEGNKSHVALYMAMAIQKAGLPLDALDAFGYSLKSPLIDGRSSGSIEQESIVLHPGSGSNKRIIRLRSGLN